MFKKFFLMIKILLLLGWTANIVEHYCLYWNIEPIFFYPLIWNRCNALLENDRTEKKHSFIPYVSPTSSFCLSLELINPFFNYFLRRFTHLFFSCSWDFHWTCWGTYFESERFFMYTIPLSATITSSTLSMSLVWWRCGGRRSLFTA